MTDRTEPIWLLRAAVLAFHLRQLAEHGGGEGIRDQGLLDSALNRPLNKFAYEEPDLFDLAAAYAYGIATNHPFVDGNKRTAYVAALTFLRINGYRVEAPAPEKYETFIHLAAGELNEEELAAWFRRSAGKVSK
ncbi:MAG: type II toxin-antitoxin system death-on-curing family toxin [Alphaproteobacteria bacterium]|nr:type II toxin-antitoxin system death-on-curing family toxin [Alphaproteobacteria bacterium]MDX5415055.1 type II toxin-antitoxin system death-on-curing family toxin [Alphaproteobacteria bacterium]MDX5492242.1 type II toxin-antitoxin system death-on-curing family toxin [Alphaproteobacteria bacterium]